MTCLLLLVLKEHLEVVQINNCIIIIIMFYVTIHV